MSRISNPRFFFQPKDKSSDVVVLTKEELEEQFGFTYVNETTVNEVFSLLPYDLRANHDVVPYSELPTRFNVLKNPLDYLQLYHDERTGWGVRARKEIPAGSVIMVYSGVLYRSEKAPDDDYLMTVALPHQSYADLLGDPMKYLGFVSAEKQGNLSRFFQHLPKREKLPPFDSSIDIACENVTTLSVFNEVSKLPMAFVMTKEAIPVDHPIGFDYGDTHFSSAGIQVFYFNLRGRSFSPSSIVSLIRYNAVWQGMLEEQQQKPGCQREKWADDINLCYLSFLRYQDLWRVFN